MSAILSPPSQPPASLATPDSPTSKRSHNEAFEQEPEAFLRPASPIGKSLAQDQKHPEDAGLVNDETANELRAGMNKPAKMRSSIACVRCRRSKVKCVNNGMNTKCRACETQNRECTYPPPATGSSSTPKRTEGPGGIRPDGESDVKRPRKREPEANKKQSLKEDPLELPAITFELWSSIFHTFQRHFSTDFPFLHEGTFFARIGQESRSPETQILLLGILSLTARFIPQLVAYPSYPPLFPARSGDPRPGEPLYASEFYARALEDRLDAVTQATYSLETIQALLMLGLHNWGMCHGSRAWMRVGTATRMAYGMGLSCEEEELPDPTSNDPALLDEARRLGVKPKPAPAMDEQAYINREIKRRTMWSCFILDRYLSSGKSRPQMDNTTLEIQLPCSEEDFRFGSQAETEFLIPIEAAEGSGSSKKRYHSQIEPVGHFIRLVDIWGACSKHCLAGGRRREKYPPWDTNSTFSQLRKQLADFHGSLPPKLAFTPSNLIAHVGGATMSIYSSIHILYSLCQVVINREYIPFIPLRCQAGPSGPVDEPTFPKDKYVIPSGFWEDSAQQVFSYARDITEILKVNDSRKILIESPQILFAVWTAAFVGIYSDAFPWMDQGCYMRDLEYPGADVPHRGGGKAATLLAIHALDRMQPNMRMAISWARMIKKMTKYFKGIRNDYEENLRLLGDSKLLLDLASPQHTKSTGASRRKSLREGGHGGGLHIYALLENKLKEFGSINEEDELSGFDGRERSSSRASIGALWTAPRIKAEPMQGVEKTSISRPSSEGTWAAVNTGHQSGADAYGQRAAPMPYKGLGSAQGARQEINHEQPTSPSLISSQNTHATPSSLSSPFGRPEHGNYHNDTQQHSQQMAAYPSSAQHSQPLLGNLSNPAPMDENQPQIECWGYGRRTGITPDELFMQRYDRIMWNAADVGLFRDGTPYDAWQLHHDGIPRLTGQNFIEASFASY